MIYLERRKLKCLCCEFYSCCLLFDVAKSLSLCLKCYKCKREVAGNGRGHVTLRAIPFSFDVIYLQ